MNRAQSKRYNEFKKIADKNRKSKPNEIEKVLMKPLVSLAVALRMGMGEKEFMIQYKGKKATAFGKYICYIATGKPKPNYKNWRRK